MNCKPPVHCHYLYLKLNTNKYWWESYSLLDRGTPGIEVDMVPECSRPVPDLSHAYEQTLSSQSNPTGPKRLPLQAYCKNHMFRECILWGSAHMETTRMRNSESASYICFALRL